MSPAQATPAHLLTLDAAARQLGVSTRTVRRRIADGSLRAYRVGPVLLRVDPADLDALARAVPTVGAAS